MAYEVTKRIKGHDYRYAVEAYRDPETKRRKARWQYLGAIDDGKVRQPVVRAPHRRVTRDDIIGAAARLLEFRDPEHVTVGVIAASAGVSHSTFYRFFANQQEVLNAAMARMCNEFLRALPSLEETPQSQQEARSQLRGWFEALHRSGGFHRALRRALSQTDGKVRLRIDHSQITEDPVATLTTFFERLNAAGLAAIQEPAFLARAIKGISVALRVAATLTPATEEIPLPEFGEVYGLIERAVFANCAAAI
jgi:AcrR family transcriptional regulator